MNNLICKTTLDYSNKIKAITSPLKQTFNISTFWYFKISSKGEFVYLTNNPTLCEYYFSNKLYYKNPFFKTLNLSKSGIFFTRAIKNDPYQYCLDLISNNCNVDQSLIFIEKNLDSFEGFAFAGSRNSSMFQSYINYLSMLHKYILYFKNEAAEILFNLENNSINIGNLLGYTFYEKTECFNNLATREKLKAFSQQILNLQEIPSLTQREKDCLKLSLQGYNARQIAENLLISSRTVEVYLNNVKNKFNCANKYELQSKVLHLINIRQVQDFLS